MRRLRWWTSGALALVAVSISMSAAAATTSASVPNRSGPYRNGLIAFVRCCGSPDTGIYAVRPDGTAETKVYAANADDAPLDPSWSPDGRQIAYVPGKPRAGVWVMRGDGTKRRRVTVGKGDSLFPSWSPDGRWIVFSDLARPGSSSHDLYRVRTDGTGLRRLTRSTADELMAACAPNGGEIVYARGRDLWHMRADGGRQRLFVRDATAPSWSPGGTHVAFVRDGDPWVTTRRGTATRRLVHLPRRQASLAWSPDGRLLVTAPADRGDLVLVRADGSSTTLLTDAPGYANSWPSWQRRPT